MHRAFSPLVIIVDFSLPYINEDDLIFLSKIAFHMHSFILLIHAIHLTRCMLEKDSITKLCAPAQRLYLLNIFCQLKAYIVYSIFFQCGF